MQKTKANPKSLPPKDADLVSAVRKGTNMTYEQTAGMLHDYRNAAQRYAKWRRHPMFPEPVHGKGYTQKETLLATSEHYRGFMLGMEAAIAAMHGYSVRDRVIEAFGISRKDMMREESEADEDDTEEQQ